MSERYNLAAQIHASVDRSYPYASDESVWHTPEYWEPIGVAGLGDCEDFVLEKRARLLAVGVALADLRIGICFVDNSQHAVLVIKDGDGDWISDQRQQFLVTADDLKGQGYVGYEIQVSGSKAWARWTL